MASGDKLTLDDFLPFPLEDSEDNAKNKTLISKKTANIFVDGVKDKVIPPKLIGAFSKYMNQILDLAGD